MVTTTQKKRNLRYLNKDFEGLKRDFIEHLRVYFPDTIQDFNESSTGIMLTEIAGFIGDNLSFYLDKKFEESFPQEAREKKNLFKHAKSLGYKAFGKVSAIGVTDAYLKVPATRAQGKIIPDMSYAGIIKRGARCKSNAGKTYETLTDINFSTVDINNPLFTQVRDRNPRNQEPTTFVLRKTGVEIKAGQTKTATFTVGAFESFKKITIPEGDVLEVLSCRDSEGNDWYETDYLAQDTVFDGVANTGDDATEVPYVLKLRTVPYRFVTEYDIESNRTSMIFGTGDAQVLDGDLIPDLGDLSLPLYGKDTFTDFNLDPQNFLRTRTLGLAPVNTTLTVEYRVGGGFDTNVGSEEIASVVSSVFDVGDSTLSPAVVVDVGNSFSVLNRNPIEGGRDELSVEELRQLISANFATQSRLVTASDFVVRSLSMPAKFGSVFRANARPSTLNKNAIELIILSRNSSGHAVSASTNLKKNLKTYLGRFRMLTDAIEILDGEVVDLGIEFEILTNPDVNRNKQKVISDAIEQMTSYFEITQWQLNQPINLTEVYILLGSVPGVLSVIDIRFFNRVGTFQGRSYSLTQHNVSENTQNGIIYSGENKIFEVKYPAKDIVGLAK